MCLLLLVAKKIKIFTNVITIQYIHSQEQIMRYFTCHPDNPIKYSICGQLISEDSFLHQKRILSEHVLIMVNDGTLLINSNNMCYSVSKGQYILLRANETHFGTNTSKYLFASIDANYTGINTTRAVKDINNSIYILSGEYDNHSREIASDYLDLNPSIEVSVVNKTKHLPQLENPNAVLNAMSIFFN